MLKPLKVEKDDYICKIKDPIEEIFFLIKGKAGMVLPQFKDSVYLVIEEGYYFGDLDYVWTDANGVNDGKRKFQIKALKNCDLLTISKTDLQKADQEYEEIVS